MEGAASRSEESGIDLEGRLVGLQARVGHEVDDAVQRFVLQTPSRRLGRISLPTERQARENVEILYTSKRYVVSRFEHSTSYTSERTYVGLEVRVGPPVDSILKCEGLLLVK